MIKKITLKDIDQKILTFPHSTEDLTLDQLTYLKDNTLVSTFPEMIVKWFNSNQYKKDIQGFEKSLKDYPWWGRDKYTGKLGMLLESSLKNKSYRDLNRTYFKQFLPYLSKDLWISAGPRDENYKGYLIWRLKVFPNFNEHHLDSWNRFLKVFNQGIHTAFKEGWDQIPEKLLKNPERDGLITIHQYMKLGYFLGEVGLLEDAETLFHSIFTIWSPLWYQWVGAENHEDIRKMKQDFGFCHTYYTGREFDPNHWARRFLSVLIGLGKTYQAMKDYESAIEIYDYVDKLVHYRLVYWTGGLQRILEAKIERHHCYKMLGSDYSEEINNSFNDVLKTFHFIYTKEYEWRDENYNPERTREPLLIIVLLLDRLYNWFN